MAEVRAGLEQKIVQAQAGLKTEIAQVRAELKTDIAGLKGELGRLEAALARMDRKFTLYFALILFAIVFLNQDALAFLARLLGRVR